MEKYRRWTDEATGINPFISARTTPIKISTVLISAVNIILSIDNCCHQIAWSYATILANYFQPYFITIYEQNTSGWRSE